MDLVSFFNPSSGPLWAFAGVAFTVLGSIVVNSRKAKTDVTMASWNAVNAGQKQLIDSLFTQVKQLGERLERAEAHVQDCEDRHDQQGKRIFELENDLARVKNSSNLD